MTRPLVFLPSLLIPLSLPEILRRVAPLDDNREERNSVRIRVLRGEIKASLQLNQRQNPRFLQFLIQEHPSALCPSGVDLDLHLTIRLHEVRRETLHIAFVEVRNVEYPLAAHLVLDVKLEQQLVEADGAVAVVLGELGDGDRLRAAQDGTRIIRERLLLCGDFFE